MIIDNLIVINGGAYNDIKKALKQWIDLYSNDLQDGLTFKLYKQARGTFIIKVDDRLDNERFYYLVNYLNYPEGIEYKIDIEGFTTGKENNKLKGKHLLVYISPTDKDGDNVFVSNFENENFKVDFGGKITETKDKKVFHFPTDLTLEAPDLLTVNKKEISRQKGEINNISLDNRFKIISLIALGLLIISLIISFNNKQAFIKMTFFLGMGLAVWFFGDYKLLQSDKHYIYSLLISILFFGYASVLKQGIYSSTTLVDLGALYPLTLLIVQKPARYIYKTFLNREPIIGNPIPTFWDGVYTITLFLVFSILPFIIDNLLG